MAQEKISVHSLADLKNTTDDAIPAYLNSLKFEQSHTLTDTRLALGYAAFAICAATFYWDYKLGFDATKQYTAVAVALYTLLNGLLTLWIWAVEKGTVYVGTSPAGDRIQIATHTEKHVPVYHLTVTAWKAGSQGKGKGETKTIMKPFTKWFDREGTLVVLPFQQMLASAVEIVGKADPGKVVSEKHVLSLGEAEEKSMDDKWTSLLAESSGASVEPGTPSKGKKRSKKAA